MRRKIAKAIVRFRFPILVLLLIVAVWSVFQIPRTNINYDLTKYLSEHTMTRKALNVMVDEFGSTEQLSVMFKSLDEDALTEYAILYEQKKQEE